MDAAGDVLDMCELWGGESRPTRVAIRRRLKTVKNVDLVTGCDLGAIETISVNLSSTFDSNFGHLVLLLILKDI